MNIAGSLVTFAALVAFVCADLGAVGPGAIPDHVGQGVGPQAAGSVAGGFAGPQAASQEAGGFAASPAAPESLAGYFPYRHPYPQPNTELKQGFTRIPVDHFSNAEVGEFMMPYVERWDLFKSGGPIFILISEDLETDKDLLMNGLLPELATESHAVLFGMEQRFSGKIPQNYYKYLTTKQLLHDIAKFITVIKDKKELIHSKIVIAGTGSSGRLAYWMRRDFSKLVDVAITDITQPELRLEDTSKMKIITEFFLKNGGETCVKQIRDRLEHQRVLLTQKNGAEELRKNELLCPGTNLTDKTQWYTFNAVIYSQLVSALSLDSFAVHNLCSNMKPWTDFTNIDYCFVLPKVSYFSNRTNYLQCNEHGSFVTANATGLIPLELPLQWYIDMCGENYGNQFNLDYVKAQVEKTNKEYAGNVSNVAFLSEKSGVTLKKTGGFPGMWVQDFKEHDAINNFKSSVKRLVGQQYYRAIDQYSFFSPSRTA